MLEVEVAVTIRRSRQEVAMVMFDPRHASAWMGDVRQAHKPARGALRHGDRLERFRHGKRIMEVVEHEAERRLILAGVIPPGLRVHYILEGIPEGTIARIRMLQPLSEGRLFGPILRARLRNTVGRAARIVRSSAAYGGRSHSSS